MDDRFAREVLFCRMVGILTPAQLDALATKTVAVAGAGGVGFTHAEALVRMGIGRIKISDFDTFGPENMGRQFGCTVDTVGRSKVEVLHERLKAINGGLVVEPFGALAPDNVGEFLHGVDAVCDAIDYFHVRPHRLLHREARGRRIPVAFSGPVGFGASLHYFDADHLSFDEYFDLSDDQSDLQNIRNWGLGLGPANLYRHYMDDRNLDFENQTGSVVSVSCLLCTTLCGSLVLGRLLGQPMFFKPVPFVYQIDLMAGKFVELHIPDGVRGIKASPEKYLR
jgi:molybdopterin/thiamine biosynthesis adenylyltransferase